MTVYNNNKKGL